MSIATEHIGTVIQGPTIFYKEIVAHYKDVPNVVWSTWEDEPAEHIAYIRAAGMPLVLQDKKGLEPGHHNTNLQCLSTYGGIEFLSGNPAITHILKIRADFLPNPFPVFLEQCAKSLEHKEMAYMGYVWYYPQKMQQRYYLVDFLNAGTLAAMKRFWRPDFNANNGFPNPEKWLENRYYHSENYLEKNYKKLVKQGAFIVFKGFAIKSLKLHIDFGRRIFKDGIYRDQPTLKERWQHVQKLTEIVFKRIITLNKGA